MGDLQIVLLDWTGAVLPPLGQAAGAPNLFGDGKGRDGAVPGRGVAFAKRGIFVSEEGPAASRPEACLFRKGRVSPPVGRVPPAADLPPQRLCGPSARLRAKLALRN